MVSNEKLMQAAREAAENSYSPYSHFSVGAALLTAEGKIYKGANVENATFGATCCAERSAVFSAVSSGEKDFVKIAVYSPNTEKPCFPCGICLQVLSEFCSRDFVIILIDGEKIAEYKLCDLLPNGFTLD